MIPIANEDAFRYGREFSRAEGVLIGITKKKKEDGVFKVSVRTDRSVNAAEYCAMFGGGGHAEAAGCTVKGTLDEAKAQLKQAAEGVL